MKKRMNVFKKESLFYDGAYYEFKRCGKNAGRLVMMLKIYLSLYEYYSHESYESI